MPIIRTSRLWCWLPHWSCFSLQPRHYSSLTAPNLQPTANQERNDQCGNQHHSRELLMMGIVMPETCWAYKKYNKIISGIYLVFYSSVITMMHGPINIRCSATLCASDTVRWLAWWGLLESKRVATCIIDKIKYSCVLTGIYSKYIRNSGNS